MGAVGQSSGVYSHGELRASTAPTPQHDRASMVALRSVMLSAMLTPRVVVFGPGSLDMRLLTAKLAARAGLETSLFVGGATAR